MKLGRVLRIVAPVVWLTAAIWYWWQFVPPAPAHVIPLQGRSSRWTPGLGDVIVLSHFGDGEGRASGENGLRRPPLFGPLQFYDPASGSLIRSVLDSDDEILALLLRPREVAIIRRSGVLGSVELDQPSKLIPLEGAEPDSRWVFAEGARIVIAHLKTEAIAFDLETGRRLWSESNVKTVSSPLDGGCEVLTLRRLNSTAEVVNARTGLRDDRLQQFGYPVASAEGGRRFAISDGHNVRVFDSPQAPELCRIAIKTAQPYSLGIRFSPDGKRLYLFQGASGSSRQLTIWDSETGRKLDRQPSSSMPAGPLSRQGDWSISSENAKSPLALLLDQLPKKVTTWLRRSTTFWNLMMRFNQVHSHFMVLTDPFSGRTFGRYQVPSTAEWLLVADDQNGVVAFGDHGEVHCYRVPADRNWLWLLKWGAGPVAAMWSLLFLFNKWRQRRRPAAVIAATP